MKNIHQIDHSGQFTCHSVVSKCLPGFHTSKDRKGDQLRKVRIHLSSYQRLRSKNCRVQTQHNRLQKLAPAVGQRVSYIINQHPPKLLKHTQLCQRLRSQKCRYLEFRLNTTDSRALHQLYRAESKGQNISQNLSSQRHLCQTDGVSCRSQCTYQARELGQDTCNRTMQADFSERGVSDLKSEQCTYQPCKFATEDF